MLSRRLGAELGALSAAGAGLSLPLPGGGDPGQRDGC